MTGQASSLKTLHPRRRTDGIHEPKEGGNWRAECLLLMLWTAPHQPASLSEASKMEESHGNSGDNWLDLGKSVFQVHGVDAGGTVVVQRRLTRSRLLHFFAKQPPCLVGMEACAAAHHWGRELSKLGHTVHLMPPSYVKPYVKRQKNDAADAEAICEAVTRPSMRFVEIKTCEQQGTLVLHRVRLMLMRQRVQLSNAIRGHMAEYGLVAPVGRNGLQRLIAILGNPDDERVPAVARASLAPLVSQFGLVNEQVLEIDRRVRASARSAELSCRLMEVPGVGPVLASAVVWSALPSRIIISSSC
jgi:transposase